MFVLTFQVGQQRCGLDVRRITEVLPRVRLQQLTGMPKHVAGMFVYRGNPLPVIDLHHLFGVGNCPEHLSSRIILVPVTIEKETKLIGLLAASVADIIEISSTNVPGSTKQLIAEGTDLLRLIDVDELVASMNGIHLLALTSS